MDWVGGKFEIPTCQRNFVKIINIYTSSKAFIFLILSRAQSRLFFIKPDRKSAKKNKNRFCLSPVMHCIRKIVLWIFKNNIWKIDNQVVNQEHCGNVLRLLPYHLNCCSFDLSFAGSRTLLIFQFQHFREFRLVENITDALEWDGAVCPSFKNETKTKLTHPKRLWFGARPAVRI